MSFRGNLTRTWMYSWTRISRGVWPLSASTSGGTAMRGLHLSEHWSSTQKAVTLSSAEAELCVIVRTPRKRLGSKVLGLIMTLSMRTDSPAAVGFKRAGIGRVRHFAVEQLWVQGLRRGDVRLLRVRGDATPADAPSARCPGQACGRLVLEDTGWTSSHGVKGAVAVEASSAHGPRRLGWSSEMLYTRSPTRPTLLQLS